MNTLIATNHLSAEQLSAAMGTYQTAEGYRLVDQSLRVVNDKGEFVAAMLKEAVPVQLQETAEPHFLRAHGDFSNRGAVVGRGAMMPRLKADGSLSRRNAVPKEVVKLLGRTGQLGWFDRYDREVGAVVCRQSSWSLDDPEVSAVAKPITDWIDYLFMVSCPSEYVEQLFAANGISAAYRISSAWTSLTVNVNSRMAVHRDRGNVAGGYAALLASGSFEGGYLLMPRYRLAFNVKVGDSLYFDPDEPHANAALEGNRLSVVLYARAGLAKCSSEVA